MPTHAMPRRCYEFQYPELDTLILVEASDAGVTIRATRDSFSEQRKLSFIHELAAEGFIPEDYAWRSLAGSAWSRGVRWQVDISWLRIDPAVTATARRFMVRLLAGGFLLWVALMGSLFLFAAR